MFTQGLVGSVCGFWLLGWDGSLLSFLLRKAELGLTLHGERWSPVDTTWDSGCFQKRELASFVEADALPFVPRQEGASRVRCRAVKP